MCTQIENVEVTESPRKLDTLLSMTSYQDMTDDEINMLIDYKVQCAKTEQDILLKAAAEIERVNATIEDSRVVAQHSADMLESLLNRHTQKIEPMQPIRFVSRNAGD